MDSHLYEIPFYIHVNSIEILIFPDTPNSSGTGPDAFLVSGKLFINVSTLTSSSIKIIRIFLLLY